MADLHIHIVTDNLTEADFRAFFASSEGSKWSPLTDFWERHREGRLGNFQKEWSKMMAKIRRYEGERPLHLSDAWQKITGTPNIWIGEVSWLKASLTDDEDSYIPGTVAMINDLIGEDWPVLDDELIEKILKSFDIPNETACRLAELDEVRAFLQEHKGEKAFTISH